MRCSFAKSERLWILMAGFMADLDVRVENGKGCYSKNLMEES